MKNWKKPIKYTVFTIVTVSALILVVSFVLFHTWEQFNSIDHKETVDLTWDFLTDSASICTAGGEYCTSANCGGEGSEIYRWIDCLNQFDKYVVASFLIKQIPDTSQSVMHVCPFQMALKGEAAIYCLQYYTKSNWYDLDSNAYHDVKHKMFVDQNDTIFVPLQTTLQSLIKNRKQCNKLVTLWRNEINQNKI